MAAFAAFLLQWCAGVSGASGFCVLLRGVRSEYSCCLDGSRHSRQHLPHPERGGRDARRALSDAGSAQRPVLHPSRPGRQDWTTYDVDDVAAGLQEFLICVEMFFAALAHAQARPPLQLAAQVARSALCLRCVRSVSCRRQW